MVSKILIGSDELIMGILDMKAIGIRVEPMTNAVEFTRGHAKSKPVPNPKKQVVWPLNHVRNLLYPLLLGSGQGYKRTHGDGVVLPWLS